MKIIHFESIDSTNTYLKNNYQNLENFTFVSANNQSQGRGRNNRKWESNDLNLLFSLLIKESNYFNFINSISIVSAYSVLQVLKEYGLNNLSIKWPNDIYCDGKKICGILLEAISKTDIDCLIIGVGLNVNQKEFAGDYIHEPTSMINQLNREVDIEELKNDIYQKLISNLNSLINNYDYYDEIKEYDYLKNKEVYALINNENKLVKVKGINKDYTLCVLTDEKEINLNSGEISFHIK